jgi:hypothetical protein
VRPRLEQAPHGCCRSHLSLAKLSVHDFVMAIEYVLSVFARVAGKLDFVSASIWRRTRTLSIVGHGVTGLRRSRSSTSYAAIWVCPKRNCPWVRSQTVSQPLQEEKEAVWRRKPRGNGESNDSSTVRPSASTLRVDRLCARCPAAYPAFTCRHMSPVLRYKGIKGVRLPKPANGTSPHC